MPRIISETIDMLEEINFFNYKDDKYVNHQLAKAIYHLSCIEDYLSIKEHPSKQYPLRSLVEDYLSTKELPTDTNLVYPPNAVDLVLGSSPKQETKSLVPWFDDINPSSSSGKR